MARNKPRCFQILMDFANLFKAFIGVNYLSIAFAISQSGIALGIVGLLLISIATVHCCHLIIKCKRELIRQIIEDNISNEHQSPETLMKTRHLLNTTLEKRLSYGDTASLSLGKVGIILVNVSLVVTQFGFCVNYFIFLGNTFQKMFPYHLPYIAVDNSSTTWTTPLPSTVHLTTDKVALSITNSSSPLVNILPYSFVSQSPGYNILVLLPLPIFILFGYLRSIRQLGPASVFANLSSLVGYVAMMVYILSDFSVSDTISWAQFSTFPIFFGQVTAAFEGIGTIVPIESSMGENSHLFPHLLYLVVLLFTCVLASLGFLSYLRLGTSTAQVIIWNLQPNSMLQLVVSLVVCIGVVFTFPLQCFPIIEIFEHLLFAPGKFCGPLKLNSSNINNSQDEVDTVDDSDLRVNTAITDSKEDAELCQLLQDPQAAKCLSNLPVAPEIPKSVWTVKRNILRTLIVLAQLGTAYAFKDEFAYISSFTGAIGSTMIAYIIPAVIHLKLKRHDLGIMIICKDILLIIFGLVGGVTGVYTSVRSIIVDFQ
ncbi:proton-coupled amino acid transporter 1-like isoform X1 [Asterias amurensis]|uniref:proton-coupled amino acid transporter 1-like isoform X1 n=2 Tax=Asterias amurensis TaxID=7602 RepID=UPI003AB1BC62